jgi:hypothetical protein
MAGQTTEQGYGWRHQQERARLARVIERDGGAWCQATVCLMPTRWIEATEPWDLGHHPGQRGHRGPEHVKCNRSDGARKSNRTGNPGARAPRRRRRSRPGLVELSVDVSEL